MAFGPAPLTFQLKLLALGNLTNKKQTLTEQNTSTSKEIQPPDEEQGQDGGLVPTRLPGEAGHIKVSELLV